MISPILYFAVSILDETKRTDYPGKEIARLVQNKWDRDQAASDRKDTHAYRKEMKQALHKQIDEQLERHEAQLQQAFHSSGAFTTQEGQKAVSQIMQWFQMFHKMHGQAEQRFM